MSLEDILRGPQSWWKVGDLKAAWRKHPQVLYDQLNHAPDALDPEARRQAEEIVAEWLSDPHEPYRYSAMLLVDRLKMSSAIPALSRRAWQLEVTPTEPALRELERVRRSLERLGPGSELPRPPETPLEGLRRQIANHCQLVYRETDTKSHGDQLLPRLGRPYERFDENERRMAEQVFSEWLLSDDHGTRVTARWIIDHCKITALLPQLRALQHRLAETDIPDERVERGWVERLITELSALQSRLD